MAGDTNNPRVWQGCDVRVADLGTTAPTDLTTAYAAGWDVLGLLSEDGMTQSRDMDSSDFYDWSGLLIRTVYSKEKRTFKVAALEDTDACFKLRNPDGTSSTTTGVTTRSHRGGVPVPMAFAFEMTDGADVTRRLLIPRGQAMQTGEEMYSREGMTMYEFEIVVYPNASTGELFVEITNDPAAVVA